MSLVRADAGFGSVSVAEFALVAVVAVVSALAHERAGTLLKVMAGVCGDSVLVVRKTFVEYVPRRGAVNAGVMLQLNVPHNVLDTIAAMIKHGSELKD